MKTRKQTMRVVALLLAKAESTTFPDEALVFRAKAQELMGKLERASRPARVRQPIPPTPRRRKFHCMYCGAGVTARQRACGEHRDLLKADPDFVAGRTW
jgi:hypothetical protein